MISSPHSSVIILPRDSSSSSGWSVIGTAGKEALGVIVAFRTYQLVIYHFPAERKEKTKCQPAWLWPNFLQTPGKGLISQAQPVLLRAGIQTSQLLSFSQGGSSALSGHLLNPISQSIQQATKKPGTKPSTQSCPKKPLGDALLSGSTSHLVASSNILLLAFRRANVVNSPNQLQPVGTASMSRAATSLPCPRFSSQRQEHRCNASSADPKAGTAYPMEPGESFEEADPSEPVSCCMSAPEWCQPGVLIPLA